MQTVRPTSRGRRTKASGYQTSRCRQHCKRSRWRNKNLRRLQEVVRICLVQQESMEQGRRKSEMPYLCRASRGGRSETAGLLETSQTPSRSRKGRSSKCQGKRIGDSQGRIRTVSIGSGTSDGFEASENGTWRWTRPGPIEWRGWQRRWSGTKITVWMD